MTMKITIAPFGGNFEPECETAKAGWGARWIAGRDYVDQLPDRQGVGGSELEIENLLKLLNEGRLRKARDRAGELLAERVLWGGSMEVVILYEDELVIIKASCWASHGYVYAAAYLR